MVGTIVLLLSLPVPGALGDPLPAPGTHAHYLVLTGKTGTAPPFASVDVVYGPRETAGSEEQVWWQLEARPEAKEGENPAPLFRLRVLSRFDPLEARPGHLDSLRIARYVLRIDATGETLEYRDVHTGKALLPGWRGFEMDFLPRRARGSGSQKGVPETAEYLGHVLTLQHAGSGVAWEEWPGARVLDLDPELLVGTSRNFRDQEGHRLPQVPQRTNYTYVPFTEEEYPVMIEAGINLFVVDDKQVAWVRGKPVFSIWGGEGKKGFPADLYRSNWLGPVMFLDEPGIIMVGDKNIHTILRYFSDAAAVLEKRIRSEADLPGGRGRYNLDKSLRDAGVNLGDLRIEQWDFPAWETLFETAHYQLEAGLPGIVHEGRYQLAPFDAAVARWTDSSRKHTPEELLRYHYAILRGGARAFGGHWGTSIYGQCDPALSPRAVTLAYDMGARSIWFWTSDHDHHMPWPEQLELARTIKKHAREHPRTSLKLPGVLDKAIAIPYGYFVSLENLWWVRALDKEGKNEASQAYRRLMGRVIAEVHRAFDAREEFDIVVDPGKEIEGYRRVVKVSDE